MSRCGINRFKAGGRCGQMSAESESCVKGSPATDSQLGANFAAMMAARDAQDAALRQTSGKQAIPSKQKDIDTILQKGTT
jgi:hypothetical protein